MCDKSCRRVTPYDAARWWGRFESDSYDCVLLDAPCSSERHVIQQAASDSGKGAKLKWSLRQCNDIAALQVKLLTAALKVSQTQLIELFWVTTDPSCAPCCMHIVTCKAPD